MGSPVLLLINKIAKVAKRGCSHHGSYAREHGFREIIPYRPWPETIWIFSSTRSEESSNNSPIFDEDFLTDRGERFFAAEFIRKKMLERPRDEIPYATAVLLTRFDESRRRSRNLVSIEANVLVEKRSQQGIVVGAGQPPARNRDRCPQGPGGAAGLQGLPASHGEGCAPLARQ